MSMIRLGFWPTVYGNWLYSNDSQENNASFDYVKKTVLLAEDVGFKTMLVAEHFINPYGDHLDQLDAWTSAAALAAVSEKIEIIAAVKPGFRAPGVIAKMASNIDHISHGRFAVNLVSAWWLPEYERLGAPILKHDDRYERSAEFIEIVRGLWTEDSYNFSGKYYAVKDACIAPLPIQKPHPPIYIGGESLQGRTLGAKYADVFLINGRRVEQVPEVLEHVTSLAAEAGREAPRYGIAGFVVCRDSEEEAWAEFERLAKLRNAAVSGADKEVVMMKQIRENPDNKVGSNASSATGLVGTPRQIADRILAFHDVGIETFLLQFHPTDEELARFGEKVVPLLQ